MTVRPAVRSAGLATLQVRLSPADAHEDGRPTAPGRTAYDLPNVMTTVRAGDFEAVTTYGVGLAVRQPYRVFTLTSPPRVVVDVDTVAAVRRPVWLLDADRFANGQEPYYRPVSRWTLPGTPAAVLLHRLYAGPTPPEHATGLRLLRSNSTGFTGLRINAGTARVQLNGGCRSGGSTASVAGEIFPTLKQFPTVQHVKLYDPRGRTEDPSGTGDSTPSASSRSSRGRRIPGRRCRPRRQDRTGPAPPRSATSPPNRRHHAALPDERLPHPDAYGPSGRG